MVGKFTKIRRGLSNWCFIKGEDGNSYFFHVSCLKNKQDRKFVWNGNSCSFDVQSTPDEKNDRAINVVPEPIKNQNKVIAREQKKQAEEKRIKREKNRQENEKRHQRNLSWGSYCDDHRYYMITERPKGASGFSYRPIQPETVYKDKTQAEEKLYFLKVEKGGEISYHLRRVIVNKIGNTFYTVKELSTGNSVGEEIYKGRLNIYA